MKLNFRQGIYRQPTNIFVPTATGVTLSTTNGTLEVSVANKDNNYFHVESNNVLNAWTAPVSVSPVWLYIDINGITGVRTFGTANQDMIVSATAPASPANGQHWFDTSTNVMKYYVAASTAFVEVIRIFVARYENGSIFQYSASGASQVSISHPTTIYTAGRILSDNTGKAIKVSDGSFLTSEDDFFTYGNIAQAIRLETDIVYARAEENIPAFSIVVYNDYGNGFESTIRLADYQDVDNGVIAITTYDMLVGEVGTVVTGGKISNPGWDWIGDSIPIGSKLWVGTGAEEGTLVPVDPADVTPALARRSPVARIVESNSIIFQQSFGVVGLRGPIGLQGPVADPATNLTAGSVRLTVPAVSSSDPIAVGDNDPRMSNARPPIDHSHPSTEVSTDAFDIYGISTVQAVLEGINSAKLNLTGGTLTGALTLSGAPTSPLHAATKQYTDNRVSSQAVLKVGDTMTGFLTLNAAPVLNLHAATKKYVDDAIGGGNIVQGAVFITDITPQSVANNVGAKVYTNGELTSATSNTLNITVEVTALSGPSSLIPTVDVNGTSVTNFSQSGGYWVGTVNLTIATSVNIIATHSDGATSTTALTVAAGPTITSAVFDGVGSVYTPHSATTSLRAGVLVNLTVTSPVELNAIEILPDTSINDDAAVVETFDVTGLGTMITPSQYEYVIAVTIADNGTTDVIRSIRLRAKNTIGSWGPAYDTRSPGFVDEVNVVHCDNLYPTATITGITYPGIQLAIKTGESASVAVTTANFTSIAYSSTADITILLPTTDEPVKTANFNAGTYNVSTNNFTVTATRALNGAVTANSTIVQVADADQVIEIITPAARLRSGGNNGTVAQDHTITISSNQQLLLTPDVSADVGTFQGIEFVDSGDSENWTRDLQIHDDDIKGTGTFSSLSTTNLAGKVVSTINAGTNYTVGGFVERDLVVDPFQNVTGIGTNVLDVNKLVAQDSDAQLMTYQVDKTDGVRVYTIVSAAGSPPFVEDPLGETVYWADVIAVNNNTTGTAFIRIEETV